MRNRRFALGRENVKEPEQTAKAQTGEQVEFGGRSCHQHLKHQQEEKEAFRGAQASERWVKAVDGEKPTRELLEGGGGLRGLCLWSNPFPVD